MAELSPQSNRRGWDQPLSEQEILEHALRQMVREWGAGAAILTLESQLGQGSVLDMRAAELLERIEREVDDA